MGLFFQVQKEKDELVDALQNQKDIINQLVCREPVKVKKLKKQRDHLLQEEEKMKHLLEVLNLSNKAMANEIENLKSESEKEKEEKEGIIMKNGEEITELKRKISQQDEELKVLKQSNRSMANEIENFKSESQKDKEEKEEIIMKNDEDITELKIKISQQDEEMRILKLALARNQKSAEAAAREKAAEADAIHNSLRSEIERLQECMKEHEEAQAIREEAYSRMQEAVTMLVEDEVKITAERNAKNIAICELQKALDAKDIQIQDMKEELENNRHEVAKSITEIAIKNAQKIQKADELAKQREEEIDALKMKTTSLEGELEAAHKLANEAEGKLQEAEAVAAKKIKEIETELKEVLEKWNKSVEALQRTERSKCALIEANRRIKEHLSVITERMVGIEKSYTIMEMSNAESKRNEDLIQNLFQKLNDLESHIKNMESKTEKPEKKKMGRFLLCFRKQTNHD